MKYRRRERHASKITDIFVFILTLILVIDCFSIYYKVLGYQITQISAILCLIVLIGLSGNKAYVSKNGKAFLAFYLFCNLFLFIFGDFKYVGYFTGVVLPYILFFLLFNVKGKENIIIKTIEYFNDIIFAICVFSLVFYVLGTLLHVISPNVFFSHQSLGWADFDYRGYFGIYYEGQRTFFFGQTIMRNIGLFLEAPVYAYVIVTALFFEFFWKNNISIAHAVVYIITLVTTFSTTGMSIGLIIVIAYLYRRYQKKTLCKLLSPAVVIVAIFIINNIVTDKLSFGNDSGSARRDDLVAAFRTFLAHPFLGTGFNDVRGLDPYRSSFRFSIITGGAPGVSNGMPFILANGGILFGLIYWLPMIFATIGLIRGRIDKRVFGLIAVQFILLMFTVTEYSMVADSLFALSWALLCRKKLSEEVKNVT